MRAFAAFLTVSFLTTACLLTPASAQIGNAPAGTPWKSKLTPFTLQLPPGWAQARPETNSTERLVKLRPDGSNKPLALCTIAMMPPTPKGASQNSLNMAFEFMELSDWLGYVVDRGVKDPAWIRILPSRRIDGKVLMVLQTEELAGDARMRRQFAMLYSTGNSYEVVCLSFGNTWPSDPRETRRAAFADLEAIASSINISQ